MDRPFRILGRELYLTHKVSGPNKVFCLRSNMSNLTLATTTIGIQCLAESVCANMMLRTIAFYCTTMYILLRKKNKTVSLICILFSCHFNWHLFACKQHCNMTSRYCFSSMFWTCDSFTHQGSAVVPHLVMHHTSCSYLLLVALCLWCWPM